jgi:hypothetical protein
MEAIKQPYYLERIKMKIQINDFVKLVPSYANNKMFKVVMANENHLMMTDVDAPSQLWEAHPDDVEIVKEFNLISEKLRNQQK